MYVHYISRTYVVLVELTEILLCNCDILVFGSLYTCVGGQLNFLIILFSNCQMHTYTQLNVKMIIGTVSFSECQTQT